MARQPQADPDFFAWRAALEERVRQLENANPYARSGMSVTAPGEVTVDGNLIVAGDFTAEGKISNTALMNPVKPDLSSNFASGWAVDPTYSVKMTRTWDFPDGFNVAQVSGAAKAIALNSTAGVDYLYVRSKVVRVPDGFEVYGYGTPELGPAGNYATGIGLGAAYIGANPGDSIRIEVEAKTEFGAWAASAANIAEWTGSITWYRL